MPAFHPIVAAALSLALALPAQGGLELHHHSVGLASQARTGKVALRFIPNADERFALCNDGSPSGFYYAPPETGSASEPPVWLLFQQGGGWCWDDESCQKRNPSLTSSSQWESEIEFEGILAEGRFASAHRVFLRYCTSDAYLGNRTKGPLGWQFRGRSVVKATIEEMFALGMGSVAGTRLLYGGCSAGGRGASYNIDWVKTLLPPTVALRGFLDSPLWIDMRPLAFGQTSLRSQVKAIAALYPEAVDETCARAHKGQHGRCLLGETLLSYVNTPSLIFAHQDDSFLLHEFFGHGRGPSSPEERQWAAELRERMVSALRALPPRHAVFSVACTGHCVSQWGGYMHLRIRGLTLQQSLERFFFEGALSRTIQECQGFNCCKDGGVAALSAQWQRWLLGALAIALVALVALAVLRPFSRRMQQAQAARASKDLNDGAVMIEI